MDFKSGDYVKDVNDESPAWGKVTRVTRDRVYADWTETKEQLQKGEFKDMFMDTWTKKSDVEKIFLTKSLKEMLDEVPDKCRLEGE